MANKLKNVLIFAISSDMAKPLAKMLLDDGVNVWGTYRSEPNLEHQNLKKFYLDLSSEKEVYSFFENLGDIKFDAVVCFQGVAISAPVENLETIELKKQLDVSLFALLNILKNLKNHTHKNSIVVSLSSMAAFGIYPFLAPYSISKASSDILLRCFEIETGVKTVSIKPGVVGTKFWQFCVNENESNFEKYTEKYTDVGKFLKRNALKNSTRGLKSTDVSKLIYKVINKTNPKTSYTIGIDAKMAQIANCFKTRLLNKIIRKFLGKRVNNE